MNDVVVGNMIIGYEYVDALLARRVDLFAMGNLKYLLALNSVVLCGTSPETEHEYVRHRQTTEAQFYDNPEGGIRDLVEWHERHAHESPWKRAAGVYVRILSQPQLFIEGNHRTGALAMSHILVSAGHPPFVLTVDNAAAYFDPSTAIRDLRKHGLAMLLRLPGLRRRLADFLAEHADPSYLLDTGVSPS